MVMKTERKYVGMCSVDSGTIVLMDPCYMVAPGGWKDGKEFCRVCGNEVHDSKYYDDITEPVLADPPAASTLDNLGVIVMPGYGDGAYPVYVELSDEGSWGKRVARVVIECISDEENEEENEEEGGEENES